jgi:hypothetical protein
MIFRNTIGKILSKRNEVLLRNWRDSIGKNGNVLAVSVNHPSLGFFAHMNVLIRVLRAAEELKAIPNVRFVSTNYVDANRGDDWLRYFFDPIFPTSHPKLNLEIQTHRDLGLSRPDDLSLRGARDLLFRNFEIKPAVLSIVDRFCEQNGVDERTLGIHYRGTDKVAEAPRVAYSGILDAAAISLSTGLFDRIFIASDEAAFMNEAKVRFRSFSLLCHEVRRSTDNKPLHLSGDGNNYQMGLSALLDCLTLARCGSLTRTCSLLSSWASIFNPDISVTLVNASYEDCGWWPERVIANSAHLTNQWSS